MITSTIQLQATDVFCTARNSMYPHGTNMLLDKYRSGRCAPHGFCSLLGRLMFSCYSSTTQSVMFPFAESKLMPTFVTGLPQRAKRWA